MENVSKSSKLTKSHLDYERALSLRENHSRSLSVGIQKSKSLYYLGLLTFTIVKRKGKIQINFHYVFFPLPLQWSCVQRCLHRPMDIELGVQGMEQCIMIQCVSSRVIMAM